jgi:hypothetical protein
VRGRTRTRHPYALSGRLLCGVRDRKMQSHWANELAYPRAPSGHQWYFGHPGDVQTIHMRPER